MRALHVLRGTRSRTPTCHIPSPRSTNSCHSHYLLVHETPLTARQSAPAVVLLPCARVRMTRQPLTVSRSRWADDWSEALQAKEVTCPSPLGDGQHQQEEEQVPHELLPLQQRMYYCSAAENDEWGTVLSSRAGNPSDQQPITKGHMQPSPNEAPQLSQQAAVCPSNVGSTHCNPRGDASTPADSVNDAVRYVAIEIGSHCTRAAVHDGQTELARLTYDTMLGERGTSGQQQEAQAGQQAQQGKEPGGPTLSRQGVRRTLDALHDIMAKAAGEAGPAAPISTDARGTGAAHALGPGTELCAGGGGDGGGQASSPPPAPRLVVRAVATAAVRSAGGAEASAFAAEVQRVVGCPLRVLSGDEEGRLAWRGAVSGCSGLGLPGAGTLEQPISTTGSEASGGGAGAGAEQRPLLVVDMGGRSTEFIYGEATCSQPLVTSLPLGCAGLKALLEQEQDQQQDQLRQAGPRAQGDSTLLTEVIRYSRQMVYDHSSSQPWAAPLVVSSSSSPHPAPRAPPFLPIFTGGTVTTVAAMHQRLPEYDRAAVHLSVLHVRDIREVMQRLAAPGGVEAALREFPWLTTSRAATLVCGCAGLVGVMEALGVESMAVSDADLLDGLLEETLAAGNGQGRGRYR